jgi:hypothetical protein
MQMMELLIVAIQVHNRRKRSSEGLSHFIIQPDQQRIRAVPTDDLKQSFWPLRLWGNEP